MGVTALWPMLEGSGTTVGLQDWLPPASSPPPAAATAAAATHHQPSLRLRLAIDLSIWLCEAQTSKILRNFHTDPAVFLTYQRTVALLKLGMQLVAVVEGDRRGIGTDGGDGSTGTTGTTRRRTNSGFATACSNCERMLMLLGVPVVRATYEGEALCE